MPMALKNAASIHPDGPLQQREQFDDADIGEEHRLLQQLWICLRRGDLKGALSLCTSKGQAWRTALLQGMMPFDDGAEDLGYDDIEDDGDEDLLAKLKEDHTDWTELGALEDPVANNGNPWRRLWKEQCWDIADRNLQGGGTMSEYEVAIYGFCAGHHDALTPVCRGS